MSSLFPTSQSSHQRNFGIPFAAILMIVCLMPGHFLVAQDATEIEGGLALPPAGGGVIDLSFSSSMTNSDGFTLSSSMQDGVRTTKGTSTKDGKFEIVTDEDGAIKVTMTRTYGVEDADELMESHPELYMYLKAIPREVGDSKINIKIEVETSYEADSADELKEENEDAHALYEKYGKGNNLSIRTTPRLLRRGIRGFGHREMPTIEFAPIEGGGAGGRVEPEDQPGITIRVNPDGDIKVTDDSKSDETSDKDESSDSETENDKKPIPGKSIK